MIAAPQFVKKLLRDAPPRYAFEVSEAGIAVARTGSQPEIAFQPLDAGVISVSPIHDNVQRMDILTGRVQALAPRGDKKRHGAAVIIPDYCVRVSVLDFDAFPPDPHQQLSLVRFRIKKSLPFDLDSAGVGYFVQPNGHNGKSVDVVVAAAPLEILARYELPFRTAGFHPGTVTTSTLAALQLVQGSGVTVFAKLSGRILTLAVLAGSVLKLVRSIELNEFTAAEIASHLYPTFAYAEDHLESRPARLVVSGLGQLVNGLRDEISQEAEIEIEPLRSRFGSPDQSNAGLLGYLESLEEVQ